MKVIKQDYSKSELISIAKTLQRYYRYNILKLYIKGFRLINSNAFSKEDRNSVIDMLDASITPSNNPNYISEVDADKILSLAGYYDDDSQRIHMRRLSRFRLPAINNIVNELSDIISEYGGFHFEDDGFNNSHITAELGPFTIDDIEFGIYQISISIPELCSDYTCKIIANAVTPNYPHGDSLHTHPHIRNQEICLGDGSQAIHNASKDARIVDIYSIIQSILKTYGSDPFIRMTAWTGNKCDDCGRYYDVEEEKVCADCNHYYCNQCVDSCCDIETAKCGNCKSTKYSCDECGVGLCGECVTLCEVCNKVNCNYHSEISHHWCK